VLKKLTCKKLAPKKLTPKKRAAVCRHRCANAGRLFFPYKNCCEAYASIVVVTATKSLGGYILCVAFGLPNSPCSPNGLCCMMTCVAGATEGLCRGRKLIDCIAPRCVPFAQDRK